jgi:hypothetical protein
VKLTKRQRKKEKRLRAIQAGDETLHRAYEALQGLDTSRFSKQMADYVDSCVLAECMGKPQPEFPPKKEG